MTPVNVDVTSASLTSVATPVPELLSGAAGGWLGVAGTVCSGIGETVGSGV